MNNQRGIEGLMNGNSIPKKCDIIIEKAERIKEIHAKLNETVSKIESALNEFDHFLTQPKEVNKPFIDYTDKDSQELKELVKQSKTRPSQYV